MIISASYRTDIPSFYGAWFMNRLRAGYCKVVNPYNGRPSTVSLRRDYVDGFVFWTKNLGPFVQHLDEVHGRGYPFVVQYTINGYPRELETSVADWRRSVDHVRRVAERFGPGRVVWRYDPILVSTLTDLAFHVDNFREIASRLRGLVDEVVISYVHQYAKTRRNVRDASDAHDFIWREPTTGEKQGLTETLRDVAAEHGMRLTICSQPDNLISGVSPARCVDARRLEAVAGQLIDVPLKGNRKECGCFESRDIGEYNTCPHGCIYCYAVTDSKRAKSRYRAHDPADDFLFRPARLVGDESPRREPMQLSLLPASTPTE